MEGAMAGDGRDSELKNKTGLLAASMNGGNTVDKLAEAPTVSGILMRHP
jgi:hypothetical protein